MIFPISKPLKEEYEAIRDQKEALIVGLTGGIASGKSTVAQFFRDLGSSIIDFDILARKAVQPGQKAWSKIVDFFGEEILLENREIDRKRLSNIVFLDSDKRKKLEAFTHPAIGEEFVSEVREIAATNNNSIIQVVVPLLIEFSMQSLFHAITVVYISPEKQIQRLTERDGIKRDQAVKILNAQMPIEKKIGYANFVIDNEGALEETRRQSQLLWHRLVDIHRDRTKRDALKLLKQKYSG
jgi:dephospho-CoA kinase